MKGEPFNVDSAEILQGRTITGSVFGGIKAKRDIPILVKQYLNKVRFKYSNRSIINVQSGLKMEMINPQIV